MGLTNSSGSVVNTYSYDPYGNLTSSTGTVSDLWRYAGDYYDSATHFYKFGIRYYDPSTGRWTQRDPVGGSLQETTKANPYVYGDDDPVSEVDPSGKCAGKNGGSLNNGTGTLLADECSVQIVEGLLWMNASIWAFSAVLAFAVAPAAIVAGAIALLYIMSDAGLQMVDGSGGNQGIYMTFYDYIPTGIGSQGW